jgi:signal transduction histidine kinase
VAVETLKAGAADYLPKTALTLEALERAVRNAIEKARLYAEVENQHQLLQQSHQAIEEQHRLLQQTHQELERQNAEIQQFYHMISHELKTPLTSARSFTTILLDELAGPLTAEQREYVDFIQDSCDQLTHGLNDLLDVTRLHTGKLHIEPHPCCLSALVTQVIGSMAPMAQKKGSNLHHELDIALPQGVIDQRRMMQVLTNLLGNALKFTPEGGSVVVRAAVEAAEPTMMSVSVSDTGRGIPHDQQARIFDRLYQTQQHDIKIEGGLGLGLHICQELVKLHGGEICVESKPNVGTTLTFTVPVDSAG